MPDKTPLPPIFRQLREPALPTRGDLAADKISKDDADDILAKVLGPKPTTDQMLHQILSYQIIQNHRTKQMGLAITELADALDEVKTVATATRGLADYCLSTLTELQPKIAQIDEVAAVVKDSVLPAIAGLEAEGETLRAVAEGFQGRITQTHTDLIGLRNELLGVTTEGRNILTMIREIWKDTV